MPALKKLEWTEKESGCWSVKSHSLACHGYPRITREGKEVYAHRWMYSEINGPIPKGLVVRHTCDNRGCVNPGHLILGTQYENLQDRNSRNRTACGEDIPAAKLTTSKVRAIRQSKDRASALADKYGVHVMTIYFVRARKTWKHVD